MSASDVPAIVTLPDGRYFKAAEFRCHDGTPYPVEWADRWAVLIALCDDVRDLAGEPCSVVSGYRTDAYNQSLLRAGHHPAADSQHINGAAADLRPQPDFGRDTVLEIHGKVLAAYQAGKLPTLGGLGLYPGWIHVDTFKAPDGHLRRWNMRT